MYKYLLIFFSLSLFQCSNSAIQEELKITTASLQEAQKELRLAQEKLAALETGNSDRLIHLVFFKIKPSIDLDSLIDKIKTLETIDEVKYLEVGPFEALGDPRAMSEYQLMMQLKFNNLDDYKIYQNHPVHQALQEYAKPFLAGPPATYDFIAN